MTSRHTVVANGDRRLEVFARGVDSALWHVWQTKAGGNWGAWASLGGTPLSAPAAARGEDGRMEAFIVGIGAAGYRARQAHPRTSEKWSAWQPMSGLLHGDPAAALNGTGAWRCSRRGWTARSCTTGRRRRTRAGTSEPQALARTYERSRRDRFRATLRGWPPYAGRHRIGTCSPRRMSPRARHYALLLRYYFHTPLAEDRAISRSLRDLERFFDAACSLPPCASICTVFEHQI